MELGWPTIGARVTYHWSFGESSLCKHGANVLAHFGDLTMRRFDCGCESKDSACKTQCRGDASAQRVGSALTM